MEAEEKETIEYTMGFGRINLIAFILIIPITAILLLPFVWIWDYETFKIGEDAFSDYFLPIFVGGIIVHELLYGLIWGYYASRGISEYFPHRKQASLIPGRILTLSDQSRYHQRPL